MYVSCIHTYVSGTCVPLGSLPRKHRRVAARSSPHYRRVGGEKIALGCQPGWCGPAVPLERGPERGSILQSTDEWLQELRPLRRPAANGAPCRILGLAIPRQPYFPFFVPALEGAFYGSVEAWFRFLASANRFLTIAQRRIEGGHKQKHICLLPKLQTKNQHKRS